MVLAATLFFATSLFLMLLGLMWSCTRGWAALVLLVRLPGHGLVTAHERGEVMSEPSVWERSVSLRGSLAPGLLRSCARKPGWVGELLFLIAPWTVRCTGLRVCPAAVSEHPCPRDCRVQRRRSVANPMLCLAKSQA